MIPASNVVVGLHHGLQAAKQRRKAAGLTVMTPAEAAAAGDIIMMLVPDEKQADIYKEVNRTQPQAGQRALLSRTASTSISSRSCRRQMLT